MIPVVGQRGLEREVVVRPVQTFSEADGDSCHLQVFIAVVGVLYAVLVIVAIVVWIVTASPVIAPVVVEIAVIVIVVIEAGVYTRLAGIVGRHRERVRAFPAEPWVEERQAVGLIVLGVGLRADGECLSFSLRYDSFIRLRIKQILDGEIGEFQSHLSDDTSLSPSCG